MSDSDDDLLPNNLVYKFQNESTTVSARGPNITASNLTGLSFRNNIITSTINIPHNFERREQSCDQRSMYYRRDTSPPMSLHSASSFRPRNYQEMHYPRGMSSESIINGRSGSPESMRSTNSNATAIDIAMAMKNVNFNKYDLRVIKEAYNQMMKRKMRKKIEKRRNLRLFMRGHRRKFGYDSDEYGSDSSISSDDCRSTRTAHTSVYRDNMTSCRSTKTDFSYLRSTMKEGNLYKDRSESFRQNIFKNMQGVAPRNATLHTQNRVQNDLPVTQRDRFKSGYLLPSQRFNQSVASVAIPEKQSRLHNLLPNQRDFESCANVLRNSSDLESDQEEIFSEITIREKGVCKADIQNKSKIDTQKLKRCLEVDDVQPNFKRSKLSSPPKKNVTEVPLQKEFNNVEDRKSNEFEFLKPQFPVRKLSNIKVKEKLLAKSAEPHIDTVIGAELPKAQAPHPHCNPNIEKEPTESNEQQYDIASTSDVSMRPSFIKRKLYTQKLDLLESKNTSSENIASPQTNVYSAIQKEKHKARKLVTNQSCLSRDVREDNNLLDLIHKIVPPDRMNATNVANKSEIANNSTKNKPDDDRWDITSVITTCNNDDVSDTYTDEEIFINDSSRKQDNSKENCKTNIKKAVANEKTPANEKEVASKAKSLNGKKKESPSKTKKKDCIILIEKLPANNTPEKVHKNTPVPEKLHKKAPVPEKPDNKKPLPEKKNPSIAETRDKNQGNIHNYAKSFWDTDFESDVEGVTSAKKVKDKENYIDHGNLTLKEKPNLNVSSKTHENTQSKFVWNSNSKPVLTLKSHCFSSQVKTVNVNKSFIKRMPENAKEKKNNDLPQLKEKQTKSMKVKEQPKKAHSKKIVLDTYNSTISDNTQNETVLNAGNKSRASRVKRTEIIKKIGDSIKNRNVPDKTKEKKLNKTPEKDSCATVKNAKPQSKQVDKIRVSKRSSRSPKELTCCKELTNTKSKTETKSMAKTSKKALDNYNSTLSDNTLDEIIKKGNRSRALRATRIKNIENSILDDSQSFNMTLRSRQLNASIGKNDKKTTTVSTRAEEKARNTSKNSQTKDTLSKPNKTSGPKSISNNSSKRHSPRTNNKVKSTPVHKRAVKHK